MFNPPPSRTNGFRLISCVFRTNNSYVYLASKGQTQKYILKFIHLNKNNIERAILECEIQLGQKHPYIMPVNEVFECEDFYVMVMPRALGGALTNVHRSKARTSKFIITVMYRICLAVEKLHSENIVHGDIKPDNIVLEDLNDDDPRPLLIDFGHAVTLTNDKKYCDCHLMTCQYAAPELLNNEPHSFPVDIWALGATFYFLITGTHLIREINDLKYMYQNVKNLHINFGSNVWEMYPKSITNLIIGALNPVPEERHTIFDLIKHPFFKEAFGEEWIRKERNIVNKSHDHDEYNNTLSESFDYYY